MPSAVIKVNLTELEPVKRTTVALMRLLHEVETSDPAMLPDSVRVEAERARAVIDEWRLDGRHRRRRRRD